MNDLISVRTNILYSKEGDEYKRWQELIFLVDKPQYRYSTEGKIIQERSVEEVRFTVSHMAFEELIQILTKLKNAKESDLK